MADTDQLTLFAAALPPEPDPEFDQAPSPPTQAARPLHHLYASPVAGLGGNSFDIGSPGCADVDGVRWRPESGHAGDLDLRAMAYRLAFTWNAAEGIPLEALEAGAIAAFYVAAVELAHAVLAGAAADLPALARRVRETYEAHRFDMAPDVPEPEAR